MRVLVIGAGALGGYYGACLVRAGRDVTFLVRGTRAEQLRLNGLQVVSPHGDFAVQPRIVLTKDLKEPFDVVLVGVKAYSLDDAMTQFAPAVGPSTLILPILNGLKHVDALAARFGAARVLGGLANVSAGLDADGRVVQFMANQTIVFGEVEGALSERALALEGLLDVPGIDVRASEAIMQDMWEKFVQLSTLAGITCLMRASIGDILAVPNGEQSIFRLFAECCAVATASGFEPRAPFIEFDRKLFTTLDSPLKASMLRDIERGSVTESEHILGDMANRARALGIETPLLDLARAHVSAYEVGRRRAAS
ncbi:2-dehydropantoate 2-reductase [Bradyrhizobium sp. 62B]|uniref:2-dehydropantoate 2-reductase n=1 Tax=unclassified Bradyrhizobium TaxID=2631580 RepID=UPI001B8A577D|nr:MULTISPECIES: 2-dehydropantoate 2-reductase [Bradyrhizobium]WIW49473.1 2-dehydropantoate 2-reductase [Bradyrhizobium sp. 62B]MBR0700727.1 2-dehydropantoate 2-reductase [Bradyrhizobium diazoefficiens]MBR0769152.1 2-dehydropantoate 2-reductase [Bradyrhizobium diazoefficiens]MBR0930568.1 2-dehydropantoate 2-reductase [Bradyrhizobium diazoefficiens]MDT4737501.1 2-dehydropantoate 2-reductase [Bradyrhizobium sp. WYCCWR 12699]